MKKNTPPVNKRGSEIESLLHSEHTVDIEKLVIGGDGLARIKFQEKSLVVFIPLTAPRDKVKMRVVRVEKNHLIGELVEVLVPSESRKQPVCSYFSACGGCSWQHVDEGEQVRQKEQILTDLLKKSLPESAFELLPTQRSKHEFNYRNRIQLKQLGSELGYFRRSSHQIVDISACPIAMTEISEQISKVKSGLKPTSEIKKFELRINHVNQFEFYPIGDSGEGLSFSQVNNEVNEVLTREIVRLVKAVAPGFLTELYAGAGNFTFPLLAELPELRIESAELNSKLTAFSTKKLTENRLQKRLFAFTADCESFVERRSVSHEFVLLDPPRSGLSDSIIEKICSEAPLNILYVSCHPAFLARDLKKIILARPEYKISYLRIFDMFPQTDHFETVILLSQIAE